MIQVCISTRPVRAQQYRTGMTKILGRVIQPLPSPFGLVSFRPFTLKHALNDGDWVVETGPLKLNKNGVAYEEGVDVRVVTNEVFHTEYRQATGDDMGAYVEAQRRVSEDRQAARLRDEVIARAKELPQPEGEDFAS